MSIKISQPSRRNTPRAPSTPHLRTCRASCPHIPRVTLCAPRASRSLMRSTRRSSKQCDRLLDSWDDSVERLLVQWIETTNGVEVKAQSEPMSQYSSPSICCDHALTFHSSRFENAENANRKSIGRGSKQCGRVSDSWDNGSRKPAKPSTELDAPL